MAPSEKALTKLLFADAEGRDLTRLSEYEEAGGYKSLRKALKMKLFLRLDLAGMLAKPPRASTVSRMASLS